MQVSSCLKEMRNYWDKLAMQNGFDGIYLILGDVEDRESEILQESADAFYNFEPTHAFYECRNKWYGISTVARAGIIKRINKYFKTQILPDKRNAKGICHAIEKADRKVDKKVDKKTYLGVFSDYDDTPRRQLKGTVYINNNIDFFKKCLRQQIQKSIREKNEYIYINAWNEWGESAYLEPDEEKGLLYLETIKSVLDEVK